MPGEPPSAGSLPDYATTNVGRPREATHSHAVTNAVTMRAFSYCDGQLTVIVSGIGSCILPIKFQRFCKRYP